eukprot:502055-Lingulodinium_polyedra.AAC.1
MDRARTAWREHGIKNGTGVAWAWAWTRRAHGMGVAWAWHPRAARHCTRQHCIARLALVVVDWLAK